MSHLQNNNIIIIIPWQWRLCVVTNCSLCPWCRRTPVNQTLTPTCSTGCRSLHKLPWSESQLSCTTTGAVSYAIMQKHIWAHISSWTPVKHDIFYHFSLRYDNISWAAPQKYACALDAVYTRKTTDKLPSQHRWLCYVYMSVAALPSSAGKQFALFNKWFHNCSGNVTQQRKCSKGIQDVSVTEDIEAVLNFYPVNLKVGFLHP